MERTEQRLRDEIGGRWAISIRTSVWALLIFILGTPLVETHPFDLQIFFRWSLASTLSLIPAGIVVWLAHRTYFRDRATSPRPLLSVVILGVIAGFIKGVLLGWFGALFGAVQNTSLSEIFLRGVNSAFIGSVALPMISLFMVYRTHYVLNRAAIINEILRVDAQTQVSKSMEFALREGSVTDMETRISEMLKAARSEFDHAKHLPLEIQWERLTKILRNTALQTIRPLSHDLNRDLEVKNSNRKIAEYVLRNIRFEILWVILLYLVTNIRNTILIVGLSNAVGLLATRVALLAVIFSGANAILSLVKNYNPYLFTLTGGIGLTIYSTIEREINKFFGMHLTYGQIVLEGIWIAFLILISGYFGAFVNKKKIEAYELQTTLQKGRLTKLQEERRNHEIAKSLAKHLHGTVQSRLMGSAMAIENAGRSGNIVELNRQIDYAYEHLQFDSIKISNLHLESLSALESDIHEKWGSLMSIQIFTSITSNLSQDTLRDIAQVVTEALSNSFRHGGATEVNILLVENDGLDITIEDNGTGYFPREHGLGSEYFGLIGGSAWSITNNESEIGTTLRLHINELGTR